MTARQSCPYCEKPLSRPKLRTHLAVNECGKVPRDIVLIYFDDEQRATSEQQFLKTVTDVATDHGWRWFHVERSRAGKGGWMTATTGAPGVPDLWLVRGAQLLVLELKAYAGRPRPGQAEWIAALDVVPGCTAIMGASPKDWPALQQLLTGPVLTA